MPVPLISREGLQNWDQNLAVEQKKKTLLHTMRYLFNEIQAFSVVHPINIRPLQTLSEDSETQTNKERKNSHKPGFQKWEKSRRSGILVLPDHHRICWLMKTRNRKYPRSSEMVGDKSEESGGFLFSLRLFSTYENSNLYRWGYRGSMCDRFGWVPILPAAWL